MVVPSRAAFPSQRSVFILRKSPGKTEVMVRVVLGNYKAQDYSNRVQFNRIVKPYFPLEEAENSRCREAGDLGPILMSALGERTE